MKIRFIEPANPPYRPSLSNLFVYDKYIRTPSNGLMMLATIAKRYVQDTLMYSESISKVKWEDVLDADIVFFSIFTFSANRGYQLADFVRQNSKAKVVIGGLHATLCPEEAARHCDYVLTGEGDETVVKVIQCVQKGEVPDFLGIVRIDEQGNIIDRGRAPLPLDIDVIPDRTLCCNFRKMTRYNTIWPQVHASRGCPHDCSYCSLVAAFGRHMRTRTPENVVEDIRQAIEFFDKGHHRLLKYVWLTDDNFFADRKWAAEVLQKIISSGIKYKFTLQARYEVGFDDEMLELLKQAGFDELAMGIEFLEDEAFELNHKKSTYSEILRSVKNIQSHGLRVRGLFIVGADNHTKGVGDRLADFVIENDISGVLIQSMYFLPGTPAYETHKDKLIDNDGDWSRCMGKVVHYPEKLTPADLQREIITASRRIYSFKRFVDAVLHKRGVARVIFMGEYFWQKSVRKELKRELARLEQLTADS